MGVEFFVCKSCGETFSDCGEYVYCNGVGYCGEHWCSEDCASDDGYSKSECSLGLCISSDGYLEDDADRCIKANNESEEVTCEGCANYIPDGCNFCREKILMIKLYYRKH